MRSVQQDRYVYDPERGSTLLVGVPSVILKYRAEDVSHYRPDGEHVIVPGRYERDLVDWARQLAPSSKQFVDCGAHMGSWTLIMATHFREVHAFEPQRLIFQQLCGNVALNGFENVFTRNVGLDDVAGQLTLQRTGSADRGGSTARSDLLPRYRDQHIDLSPETIDVVTLDSLSHVLTDVGLVKIDVEGLELRVLKGALSMLKTNDLPKLIIECWAHDWYRHDKEALLDFLDDVGYRVMPITGYGDMLLAVKR